MNTPDLVEVRLDIYQLLIVDPDAGATLRMFHTWGECALAYRQMTEIGRRVRRLPVAKNVLLQGYRDENWNFHPVEQTPLAINHSLK